MSEQSSDRHYRDVLAPHYSWMFGGTFESLAERQSDVIASTGVKLAGDCVDLGCGPGFQTAAMLKLGARHVHAFDTSAPLLDELTRHCGSSNTTLYNQNLCRFREYYADKANTVVCMGDTLTHLPDDASVRSLMGDISDALVAGGSLILSWRDLSQPPKGLDRFIPVRADDEKSMICFLEDQGDRVLVHDLISRRHAGSESLEKGAYFKLKISAQWLTDRLKDTGFSIVFNDRDRGMNLVRAVKQPDRS